MTRVHLKKTSDGLTAQPENQALNDAATRVGVSPEDLVAHAERIIRRGGTTVVVANDRRDMDLLGARIVRNQILMKKDSVLGLATGSAPAGMYAELVRMHRENGLDFSLVTTFNLDEYHGVSPTDPHSYHHHMDEMFFGTPTEPRININRNNIYIPDGNPQDIQEFCMWYEDQIMRKGGIDLQIMGIGGGFRNNIGELRGGHIAFCESPTEFASRTGYVALLPRTRLDNARFFMTEGETRNEQGRIHRGGVDVTEEVVARVPRGALTMGVSTILNAKKCLQVAYGQHKAEILVASIEGEVTPNIPASFLQKHTNVVILLDKDAASKLTLEPVWKKTEHA